MPIGYIYRIDNLENGKFYIGQTIQTLQKRWNDHVSDTKNLSDEMVIHLAMRKYGVNMFTMEPIHTVECETKIELKKQLNDLEIHEIEQLKPEYNVAKGGLGHAGVTIPRFGADNHFYGKKHTEEAKQRMSEASKGRFLGIKLSEETKRKMSECKKGDKHPFKNNPDFRLRAIQHMQDLIQSNKKRVSQFTDDDIFIQEFESVKEAAESINVAPSSMTICLKGRTKTSGGFKWKYSTSSEVA
jgi:group I intron endonuclease